MMDWDIWVCNDQGITRNVWTTMQWTMQCQLTHMVTVHLQCAWSEPRCSKYKQHTGFPYRGCCGYIGFSEMGSPTVSLEHTQFLECARRSKMFSKWVRAWVKQVSTVSSRKVIIYYLSLHPLLVAHSCSFHGSFILSDKPIRNLL